VLLDKYPLQSEGSLARDFFRIRHSRARVCMHVQPQPRCVLQDQLREVSQPAM
jgi:hypothetical protein